MSPRALIHAASVRGAAGTSTAVNFPSFNTKPCSCPSGVKYRPTIAPEGVIAVASVSVTPGEGKSNEAKRPSSAENDGALGLLVFCAQPEGQNSSNTITTSMNLCMTNLPRLEATIEPNIIGQ